MSRVIDANKWIEVEDGEAQCPNCKNKFLHYGMTIEQMAKRFSCCPKCKKNLVGDDNEQAN